MGLTNFHGKYFFGSNKFLGKETFFSAKQNFVPKKNYSEKNFWEQKKIWGKKKIWVEIVLRLSWGCDNFVRKIGLILRLLGCSPIIKQNKSYSA